VQESYAPGACSVRVTGPPRAPRTSFPWEKPYGPAQVAECELGHPDSPDDAAGNAEFIACAREDLPRAVAALRAVLEIAAQHADDEHGLAPEWVALVRLAIAREMGKGRSLTMADHLSERDDLTLRTLAFIERTTVAEQRRKALRVYAQQARQDANVAEIVRLMLASRRERESGGGNVIRLRSRHG
jgi:hypothetical protein